MNLTSLANLTYGVYVVSSKYESKINGCIVNSIFQVTAENPSVAISISKNNLTHELIRKSGIFTISILEKQTPILMIGNFGYKSGKNIDKYEKFEYEIGKNGAPILKDNIVSYIESEVINSVEVGTHTIFIGKIIDCENLSKAEPLTYAHYHNVRGGKAPKNAPSYVQQEAESTSKALSSNNEKYKCKICNYIYDMKNESVSFDDLSKNWVCPICGVTKDNFNKMK